MYKSRYLIKGADVGSLAVGQRAEVYAESGCGRLFSVVTSPVVSYIVANGQVWVETRNSIYATAAFL